MVFHTNFHFLQLPKVIISINSLNLSTPLPQSFQNSTPPPYYSIITLFNLSLIPQLHFFIQPKTQSFSNTLTMPPRAIRAEVDYMYIIFREGENCERQRSIYVNLFNCSIILMRYADKSYFRNLDFLISVHWMLNKLELTHFCALSDRTYVKLTLEFLSSFGYYMLMVSRNSVGIVKLRMFNKEYEFSQDHIADLLHFTHGDGIACEGLLEGEWKIEVFRFWEQLTSEATSDWEGLKSTSIHNPTMRYLHRILANTIFGRVNNGKVNSKELFFLHSALT